MFGLSEPGQAYASQLATSSLLRTSPWSLLGLLGAPGGHLLICRSPENIKTIKPIKTIKKSDVFLRLCLLGICKPRKNSRESLCSAS